MPVVDKHEAFTNPKSDDPIWRYVDVAGLLYLLHTRTLYFPAAARLGDAFEGSYPAAHVTAREEHMRVLGLRYGFQGAATAAAFGAFVATLPQRVFISCWHQSQTESAAMWNRYRSSAPVFAVVSSVASLRSSVNSRESIFIGEVQYIDYGSDNFDPRSNILTPFVHKRVQFNYEREIRAVVARLENLSAVEFPVGISIDVNLDVLIHEVVVGPETPDWVSVLVREVASRLGWAGRFRWSTLRGQPVY